MGSQKGEGRSGDMPKGVEFEPIDEEDDDLPF